MPKETPKGKAKILDTLAGPLTVRVAVTITSILPPFLERSRVWEARYHKALPVKLHCIGACFA